MQMQLTSAHDLAFDVRHLTQYMVMVQKARIVIDWHISLFKKHCQCFVAQISSVRRYLMVLGTIDSFSVVLAVREFKADSDDAWRL